MRDLESAKKHNDAELSQRGIAEYRPQINIL